MSLVSHLPFGSGNRHMFSTGVIIERERESYKFLRVQKEAQSIKKMIHRVRMSLTRGRTFCEQVSHLHDPVHLISAELRKSPNFTQTFAHLENTEHGGGRLPSCRGQQQTSESHSLRQNGATGGQNLWTCDSS